MAPWCPPSPIGHLLYLHLRLYSQPSFTVKAIKNLLVDGGTVLEWFSAYPKETNL